MKVKLFLCPKDFPKEAANMNAITKLGWKGSGACADRNAIGRQ
jgi:hypothetical protein